MQITLNLTDARDSDLIALTQSLGGKGGLVTLVRLLLNTQVEGTVPPLALQPVPPVTVPSDRVRITFRVRDEAVIDLLSKTIHGPGAYIKCLLRAYAGMSLLSTQIDNPFMYVNRMPVVAPNMQPASSRVRKPVETKAVPPEKKKKNISVKEKEPVTVSEPPQKPAEEKEIPTESVVIPETPDIPKEEFQVQVASKPESEPEPSFKQLSELSPEEKMMLEMFSS